MVGMSTLLAMLDAVDDLPQAVDLRKRSCEGLGDVVVDVGCGSGRAVAELTHTGVHAIGVDLDPEMIEVARQRWPEAEFHVADATALPLDDGSVTGYRADKVLHTLDEPGRAVAEARRVLRPGGRAVLVGQDWDTMVIDSDDPVRTRALVHARADGMPSPHVARRYRNLLLDNGFTGVTVEVHTLVFTGPVFLPMLRTFADDDWFDEQAARAERDRLFAALPMFLVCGARAD
jgi:ubiquinone/menaquinone biosynthesis C-methylase UbiE